MEGDVSRTRAREDLGIGHPNPDGNRVLVLHRQSVSLPPRTRLLIIFFDPAIRSRDDYFFQPLCTSHATGSLKATGGLMQLESGSQPFHDHEEVKFEPKLVDISIPKSL